jgi:hypothetical protein
VNTLEDNYRHTVQGDIPEVPSDATLMHAGPLMLKKLPPRLVPKFDVMPEPIQDPPMDGQGGAQFENGTRGAGLATISETKEESYVSD